MRSVSSEKFEEGESKELRRHRRRTEMARQGRLRRQPAREVRLALPEQKRPSRRQVSARRHRPASSNRFARERPWRRRGFCLFVHRSFGDGASGNRLRCSMPANRRRKAYPPGRRHPAEATREAPRWLQICVGPHAILDDLQSRRPAEHNPIYATLASSGGRREPAGNCLTYRSMAPW